MEDKLRIMLVDDHRMFRDALRSLLEKVASFEVVAETGEGTEVIALARESRPDIVCMDIALHGLNGVEITRNLLNCTAGVKVIALSTHADQKYILDMLEAGASGYVTKDEASDELMRAIMAVRFDRKYLSAGVSDIVTCALLKQGSGQSRPTDLGVRERQVLQLVAVGLTSVQIGMQLHIASSTVEVHRRNIMRKLNTHSVAELTRYAVSHGLA